MIGKFIILILMINIKILIVDNVKILDIYSFIKTGIRGGLIRIFIYLIFYSNLSYRHALDVYKKFKLLRGRIQIFFFYFILFYIFLLYLGVRFCFSLL